MNFNASIAKSENLHFDVLLMFEPEKCRGVICHNTEE